MDIQLEKYKLMEWLVSLKEESIISKIKNIKNSTSDASDWSDDVSETEKLLVKAGLIDINEGNTFTHEQVMEDINDAYGI